MKPRRDSGTERPAERVTRQCPTVLPFGIRQSAFPAVILEGDESGNVPYHWGERQEPGDATSPIPDPMTPFIHMVYYTDWSPSAGWAEAQDDVDCNVPY